MHMTVLSVEILALYGVAPLVVCLLGVFQEFEFLSKNSAAEETASSSLAASPPCQVAKLCSFLSESLHQDPNTQEVLIAK